MMTLSLIALSKAGSQESGRGRCQRRRHRSFPPIVLPLIASLLLTFLLGVSFSPAAVAQQPEEVDAAAADGGPALLDAEALKVLVAPVALYPDEILAVVLPASTTGLQVVQAQRYLDQHKTNAALKPNEAWDPTILALLNYPDVLARLNADLDWTQRLGDAVINQQADVMGAIQQIRNEAVASGYLKSDAKTTVTQNQETVVIQSADPQVIYVPTYDPQVIVEQTYVTAPPPAYYPPYPPYYSPAATFFTGMFVGGALAYAFDWDNDNIDIDRGDVNINNSRNFNGNNINRDNINRPTQHGNRETWKGNQKRPSTRPSANNNRPNGLAPVNRPTTLPGKAGNNGGKNLSGATNKAGNKAGQLNNRIGNNKAATGKGNGGFGNIAPGQQIKKDSQRGAQSLKNSPRGKPSAAPPRRPNSGGGLGNSRSGGGAVRAQQQRGGGSRGQRR